MSPVARLAALLVALALGCSDETAPPTSSTGRWPCEGGWVASARGGCGPAVLLCAPGGGAAEGACDGIDLSRPSSIALPDGGAVRGFYRLPDGAIAGGWPEFGDPAGPPSQGRQPDAGVGQCPEGWARTAGATCDPVLRAECPEGSEALPGTLCTPTSSRDCPAGDYLDPGPAAIGARVVHVRAGADTLIADGSVAHPFASITAGITRAGPGGWFRLAGGEYREAVRGVRGANVHVVGACAVRVTVRGPGPLGPEGATVAVEGAGAELDLRGVTVTGAGRGLQVSSQAVLRVTAVAIVEGVEAGAVADGAGARLEMTGVVVRGTRSRSDDRGGEGLSVTGGASLRASGVVVVDSTGGGVVLIGPRVRAELGASVVRDTRPRRNGRDGYGIFAAAGASLGAAELVVIGNTSAGVLAEGTGTSVELRGSMVSGTQPLASGRYGYGLFATSGAALRLAGVTVSGNAALGAGAIGDGTVVELSASVVRGTRQRSDGTLGDGLGAQEGATLRATGVLVTDNAGNGVDVSDPGALIEVAGSVVQRNRGRGMLANRGSTMRATGVVVVDNSDDGVSGFGEGSRVVLSESVVRGTRTRTDGGGGHGLGAFDGALLEATRVMVADNTEVGALASTTGSQIELTASVVRGTRPNRVGRGGMGLVANQGASLRASGVAVVDSTDLGVALSGEGTRVDLVASLVSGTRADRDGKFGRGLNVQDRATLRALGVLVVDSVEVGVFAAEAGSRLELTDTLVLGVAPSVRGFGVGWYAFPGASVEGTRVALQGVHGAGVVALPLAGMGSASVTVRDLFIRGVAAGTVRFNESHTTTQPEGRSVAYGLHAGPGCVIDATRAVIDDGEFGFYNAGGTLRIDRGVITRQRGAAGARAADTPAGASALTGVVRAGNVDDGVVVGRDLPTASSLPPPESLDLNRP